MSEKFSGAGPQNCDAAMNGGVAECDAGPGAWHRQTTMIGFF
jgi:hypothetical protein